MGMAASLKRNEQAPALEFDLTLYADGEALFADSALASLNASVDMCQRQDEACDQVMYSVKDGRVLSPATRALLSMLQGSRIPGGGMLLQHQQLEFLRNHASPYVGVVFSMNDKSLPRG